MENNPGYPNLTRGLVGGGYSDDGIAKIMGGSFVLLIGETIG
jgi:membrane dipeptidase